MFRTFCGCRRIKKGIVNYTVGYLLDLCTYKAAALLSIRRNLCALFCFCCHHCVVCCGTNSLHSLFHYFFNRLDIIQESTVFIHDNGALEQHSS